MIDIPTLRLMRLRADLIHAYLIVDEHEDINIECFIIIDSDSYAREHPFKLRKI